ncbi:unnamed protein product [Rotaria sordida]|uniref:Uncharacterized protein n=1 Tax=Rotaria sordida TaxID=392033 RepID=A0A815ENC6_9BILA|nr:unnamed protein product [Rotaria sordida]CAF4010290.1 unnamed protein product [Rotaria sordida]
MSRIKSYYCSCSTCTQIRNEQPKHYRYINLFRYLFTCTCCSSKRKLIIEKQQKFSSLNNSRISTITFRDIDITNKHCSKHDVMIKASRPYFSKIKNQELRQRVKDANHRWTRMSILPANLIDFIFKNKDFIPLCTICYENLSLLEFNLCHRCINTLINYQPTNILQSTIENDKNTLTITPNTTILNYNEKNIS